MNFGYSLTSDIQCPIFELKLTLAGEIHRENGTTSLILSKNARSGLHQCCSTPGVLARKIVEAWNGGVFALDAS